MTTKYPDTPDVVDHGVSDVLSEDDTVRVPMAVAELAKSLEQEASSFVPDVPDWYESPD